MIWPFSNFTGHRDQTTVGTKVVVEIPDALDPLAADQKYVDPLRQLLAERQAGSIIDVAQGAPNTVDEFTRIITLKLTHVADDLELIGEFVVEKEAPAGTLTQVYDANGNVIDHFILLP